MCVHKFIRTTGVGLGIVRILAIPILIRKKFMFFLIYYYLYYHSLPTPWLNCSYYNEMGKFVVSVLYCKYYS